MAYLLAPLRSAAIHPLLLDPAGPNISANRIVSNLPPGLFNQWRICWLRFAPQQYTLYCYSSANHPARRAWTPPLARASGRCWCPLQCSPATACRSTIPPSGSSVRAGLRLVFDPAALHFQTGSKQMIRNDNDVDEPDRQYAEGRIVFGQQVAILISL